MTINSLKSSLMLLKPSSVAEVQFKNTAHQSKKFGAQIIKINDFLKPNYENMTHDQLIRKFEGMSSLKLRKIRSQELINKRRKLVISAINKALNSKIEKSIYFEDR